MEAIGANEVIVKTNAMDSFGILTRTIIFPVMTPLWIYGINNGRVISCLQDNQTSRRDFDTKEQTIRHQQCVEIICSILPLT